MRERNPELRESLAVREPPGPWGRGGESIALLLISDTVCTTPSSCLIKRKHLLAQEEERQHTTLRKQIKKIEKSNNSSDISLQVTYPGVVTPSFTRSSPLVGKRRRKLKETR